MKFTSCASSQVFRLFLWFLIFSETRDSFPFTQIEDQVICDPPSGHTPAAAHRSDFPQRHQVLGLDPSSSQIPEGCSVPAQGEQGAAGCREGA